jgi:two-component system, OmpR family, phosphate regulon sensor histidine kinase PhoR
VGSGEPALRTLIFHRGRAPDPDRGHRAEMARASITDRQAFVIALAPALLALALLAATGVIPPAPAGAVAALLGLGGMWYLQRIKPRTVNSGAAVSRPGTAIPHDILDRLPDPVILLNRGRVIVSVNRSARELFGIGMPGRDLALSLRHPAVLAGVESVFTGVPELTEEIALPVPIQRTFTMHVSRVAEIEDAGPAVILVLHDETRAKRAEQSRADFVANASHELRSPLSALIGFIETLRGPARSDAEARERFLEIMRAEALRMARLIEDLLSLSRVEINEHVPPRTRIGIADVLENTANTLDMRAADKDMTIVVDCPGDLPMVVGDRDQLSQVFHNLLDNAVKYGRRETPIHVTARAVDAMPGSSVPGVAVAITDQGDGIGQVHLPRITERFYRADEGRSRKMGGTGLGLAIVKHIISRHRGQLKIVSRPGEGSTFTVYLPTREHAAAAPVIKV